MDLIGKTVRWEAGGMWAVIAVTELKGVLGYHGVVLDPGTYIDPARDGRLRRGELVAQIDSRACTVVMGTHGAGSLVGETVAHVANGRWKVVRVTSRDRFGHYVGTVVDSGVYWDWVGSPVEVGEVVGGLPEEMCTVIDSEPDTQDPECE